MRKIIPFSFFLLSVSFVFGQQLDPVKWSQNVQKISDSEYNLIFTANVDDGWYVYSQYLESDDGPIRTSVNFNDNENIELVGESSETGNKKEGFDKMFDMNLVKFADKLTITQRVKTNTSSTVVSGYLEYMTCDNGRCLPPTEIQFSLELK